MRILLIALDWAADSIVHGKRALHRKLARLTSETPQEFEKRADRVAELERELGIY